MEIGVLHVPAVDEEILVAALLACRLWLAHESRNAAHGGLCLNGEQLLIETLAEDIDDALVEIGGAQGEHLLSVTVKGEAYLRIDEHYALKCLGDVAHLRGVGLEEFPACRDIEEEILYEEIATYGA